jgi:hypothetical protein
MLKKCGSRKTDLYIKTQKIIVEMGKLSLKFEVELLTETPIPTVRIPAAWGSFEESRFRR